MAIQSCLSQSILTGHRIFVIPAKSRPGVWKRRVGPRTARRVTNPNLRTRRLVPRFMKSPCAGPPGPSSELQRAFVAVRATGSSASRLGRNVSSKPRVASRAHGARLIAQGYENDPQQLYRSTPPASTFGSRMLLQRVEARTNRKQTARSSEPLQGRCARPRDEIRGLDPLSFAQRDRASVRRKPAVSRTRPPALLTALPRLRERGLGWRSPFPRVVTKAWLSGEEEGRRLLLRRSLLLAGLRAASPLVALQYGYCCLSPALRALLITQTTKVQTLREHARQPRPSVLAAERSSPVRSAPGGVPLFASEARFRGQRLGRHGGGR